VPSDPHQRSRTHARQRSPDRRRACQRKQEPRARDARGQSPFPGQRLQAWNGGQRCGPGPGRLRRGRAPGQGDAGRAGPENRDGPVSGRPPGRADRPGRALLEAGARRLRASRRPRRGRLRRGPARRGRRPDGPDRPRAGHLRPEAPLDARGDRPDDRRAARPPRGIEHRRVGQPPRRAGGPAHRGPVPGDPHGPGPGALRGDRWRLPVAPGWRRRGAWARRPDRLGPERDGRPDRRGNGKAPGAPPDAGPGGDRVGSRGLGGSGALRRLQGGDAGPSLRGGGRARASGPSGCSAWWRPRPREPRPRPPRTTSPRVRSAPRARPPATRPGRPPARTLRRSRGSGTP